MSRNIVTGDSASVSEEVRTLQSTGKGKLLFTEHKGKMLALLLQNDRLTAAQVLPDKPSKIGAIYIGKVKNVVPNLDACFVEIAHGEICFLPKKEAQTPYVLNRSFDGRILEGDELLVQITRDAQKTKQPSVTAHISISNDAFALSFGNPRTGYSGKLSKEQKSNLNALLEKHHIVANGQLVSPLTASQIPATGLVVRTLAKDYEEEALLTAYQSLSEQWVKLLTIAAHRVCFSCLLEPPAAFEAVLEQLVYPYEYEEILTDDAELYEALKTYCNQTLPNKSLRFYEDTSFPLSKLYSLNTKLDTALNTRVWLKSGGYLVIEPTEALTVIDVNSGKFEAKKTSQEAMYKINMEAAEEIALQLRLRNLSGMIIVDFINMTSKEQQLAIVERLRKLVRKDKMKTLVVDITPLGLVEITRKKGNKTLREQFSECAK